MHSEESITAIMLCRANRRWPHLLKRPWLWQTWENQQCQVVPLQHSSGAQGHGEGVSLPAFVCNQVTLSLKLEDAGLVQTILGLDVPLLQTKTAGRLHIFLVLAKVPCLVRNMKKYAWFCFLGFNHCYHPSSSSQRMCMRRMIEDNKERINLYYKIQSKASTFQMAANPFPASVCRAVSPCHAKCPGTVHTTQSAPPQCRFPHNTSNFCTPFTSLTSLNPPLQTNTYYQMNVDTDIFLRSLGVLFNIRSRCAHFLILLLHFTFFSK